jgi:transmembrane sensor
MNVTEFPDLSRAREEAVQWIARLDRGLQPAERTELRRWCAASPANTRALHQLSGLWTELDVMKALADVIPEGLQHPAPAAAERRRGLPAVAAGVAVAMVLAGAAAIAWIQHRGDAPPIATVAHTSYAAALGEQRDYQLADGSTLAVNTSSLVEVLRLDAAARELRLQRGEALFSVAHDASRPFRVEVGGHIVEAVGTEFDIRLHEGGVIDVMVTEGRVRLLSGSAVTGMLDHGQAMRIEKDGTTRVKRLDGHELASRLAWRRGMIEFRGQPLTEALEEFSRYTPVRFVVTDPAASRTPIGGAVPAGDVEWLLEALRTNFGLESTRGPDGSIRIAPKR